jgi:hypothetical protein
MKQSILFGSDGKGKTLDVLALGNSLGTGSKRA